MRHGPGVFGSDGHRGVQRVGRRAANQQRHAHAAFAHARGHVRHFLERGGDEAGKPDGVGALFLGGAQDALGAHHDAEIHDAVIVAGQHHRHDVLADVVHVALDGGQHHGASPGAAGGSGRAGGRASCRGGARLLALYVRQQHGDRLAHDACALHHLRQEHLSLAEEAADDVHPLHQGALDHVQRARQRKPDLLDVLRDVRHDSSPERITHTLVGGQGSPRVVGLARFSGLGRARHFQQALGGVRPARQQQVLDPVAQVGGNILVGQRLRGIHDADAHARAHRVVQEHRVDRGAQAVVAAERERHVGNAARHARSRQLFPDEARRLEIVDPVPRVLFKPGAHGENVRVQDDVLGPHAGRVHQKAVGAFAYRGLAREAVRLALFVESHHHHGGAQARRGHRAIQEHILAFLQADGVQDALALQALQPRQRGVPVG